MKEFFLKLVEVKWLSKNVGNLIAVSFVAFCFFTYRAILLKEVKATETVETTIIQSITNILMIIIGFYFGSSKGSKDKQEKLEEAVKVINPDYLKIINDKKKDLAEGRLTQPEYDAWEKEFLATNTN